jgi:hypothetical protein
MAAPATPIFNATIANAIAFGLLPPVLNGNSGAAFTVAWPSGASQKITLTANCTFTFTAPPAPLSDVNLTLYVTQDGTGSRTATWPAIVKWTGAAAPTLTTTAAAVDIITFKWDGTNYWGVMSPNFA